MRETIAGVEVDLSRLYPDLRPLASLIRQWAYADSERRLNAIRAASAEDLTALSTSVDALWDSIHDYTDEFLGPEGAVPNEADVLGFFATAVMEAGWELGRREGS